MLADKVYDTFTNAKRDRELPIGELLVRKSAAWQNYQEALERLGAAGNPIARFAGHIIAGVCEIKYCYYEGIILQQPDGVRIMAGEFGSTTDETKEDFRIDSQDI